MTYDEHADCDRRLNEAEDRIVELNKRIKELEIENKQFKETTQKFHRRTQEAESALIEWQKFSKLTKKQSTGRFFPAMMRHALTKAEEQVNELKAENEQLKKIGWYLYQNFSDYGELSTPGVEVFSPDQKFKEKVLNKWQQALKKDK